MPIRLTVSTPDGDAFDGEVDHFVVPAAEGSMAVFPRHAPIVALLKPGDAAFHVGGDRRIWELGEGVLEGGRDGALIVVSSARCVQ